MKNYPVGPKARERAAKTTPGMLASLLNRMLYSADTVDAVLVKGSNTTVKKFGLPVTVFRCDDPVPRELPVIGIDGHYFESEQLLLAIRDYLEFQSLSDVID